jgi:hypothetical protein
VIRLEDSNPAPYCAICLSKDHKIRLRRDGSCTLCMVNSPIDLYQSVPRRHSQDSFSLPIPGNYGHDFDRSARRSSLAITPDGRHPPTLEYPSSYRDTHLISSNLLVPTNPDASFARRPFSYPQEYTRTLQIASSTTNKQASKDRHKLSEKHRRDANGALVHMAHLYCTNMERAVRSECQTCIDEQHNERPTSAHTCSPLSQSSQSKLRKPKNTKIEDIIQFLQRIMYHHFQDCLPKAIQDLQEYSEQLAREKENGLATADGEKKRKKWSDDVHADIVANELQSMLEQIDRHRLDPEPPCHAPRKRKRSHDEDSDGQESGRSVRSRKDSYYSMETPTSPRASPRSLPERSSWCIVEPPTSSQTNLATLAERSTYHSVDEDSQYVVIRSRSQSDN